MEIGENPASVEAPGEEGGADGAQVGQVRPRCPGVSAVRARPGVARRKLGPRILLWESGFNSQSLPRRKAMERVRRTGRVRGSERAPFGAGFHAQWLHQPWEENGPIGKTRGAGPWQVDPTRARGPPLQRLRVQEALGTGALGTPWI